MTEEEKEKTIKLCDDISFIVKYRDKLKERWYLALMFRHGHIDGIKHTFEVIGKMTPNYSKKKNPIIGVSKNRAWQNYFIAIKMIFKFHSNNKLL
jgi:hypothetical protein